MAIVQKLFYISSLYGTDFWRTQAWDLSLSSTFCARDRLSHKDAAFIWILVCQNRMGTTVGSSEELDFLTMLILSLWSFITFESQLLTSWSIFCSLDTQVSIFLGCPATRTFLRIHWNLFVHKEEKYIFFLIHKVWNEENNRFYNSATLCSFRYKRSSSLLLFLSYSIPIPSLLLTKKQHYSRYVVVSLQDTARFFSFFFILSTISSPLKADWSFFLSSFSVSEKQFQQGLSRTVIP